MDIDLQLEQLRSRVSITPEIRSKVKSAVQRRRSEYDNKVDQMGIPDGLKNLFLLTGKAQAEKFCRQAKLSEYDFFLLIHNCSQIHFSHRSNNPKGRVPRACPWVNVAMVI